MVRQAQPFVGSLVVSLAFVAAAQASDAVPRLKEGFACTKLDAVVESATHHCYFEPKQFGPHDYTDQNNRAEHVVNTLTKCLSIEILADEDFVDPAAPDRKLRRLRIACE